MAFNTLETGFSSGHPGLPENWERLSADRPDLVDRYAAVPLSSVIRGGEAAPLELRRNSNVVDVITRMYGLGVLPESYRRIAASVGSHPNSVFELSQAGLMCLSQDSGINLPHSSGPDIGSRSRTVRRVTDIHHRLSDVVDRPGVLTPLERTVVLSYMAGLLPDEVASAVTAALNLPGALNPNAVKDIVEKAASRVNHVKPAVKAQRAVIARELLAREQNGEYQNLKASATGEVLRELTDSGIDKTEVGEMLGIPLQYIQGMIVESYRDIQESPLHTELQQQVRKSGRKRGDARSAYPVGIVPYMYDLYFDFRKSLGETVQPDGTLSAALLSGRERRYLMLLAEGHTGLEVASLLDINPSYASAIAKMLLHENHTFTLASKRQERKDIITRAASDFKSGILDIEPGLLTPSGVGFERILDAVSGTTTLREAVDAINSRDTAGKLSWAQLQRLMSRLEAYYHMNVTNGNN